MAVFILIAKEKVISIICHINLFIIHSIVSVIHRTLKYLHNCYTYQILYYVKYSQAILNKTVFLH